MIDDVLNAWGRLDIWVCSSGLLGPPSIEETTPTDLQKCFEANSMAPFFALKYAPPAMAKTTPKGNYPNAAPKDQKYGSIIVVSSTASTYGGAYAETDNHSLRKAFREFAGITDSFWCGNRMLGAVLHDEFPRCTRSGTSWSRCSEGSVRCKTRELWFRKFSDLFLQCRG